MHLAQPSLRPAIPRLKPPKSHCNAPKVSRKFLVLCNSLAVLVFSRHSLMSYRPQRRQQPKTTRKERDKICVLVAVQTIIAVALSVVPDDAVGIKDGAIKQVEDIARDGRAQRH